MSKGATGPKEGDASADVRSLDVVLFELACGRLPFLSFVDPSKPCSKRQLLGLPAAMIEHIIAWRVSAAALSACLEA